MCYASGVYCLGAKYGNVRFSCILSSLSIYSKEIDYFDSFEPNTVNIFYLFCLKRHTMHIGAHRPYIVYVLYKWCIPYSGEVWKNAKFVSPFNVIDVFLTNRPL